MALYLKDLTKKDINEMFDVFYVNNVILPINKINQLYEKKQLNIDRLKAGLKEYNNENNTDYEIQEIIVQGSIAMGTSVSADEKNYDIDIAIVMDKEKLPEGTLASKRIISESLKKKCYNMKNEPDPTGNSITIEYEEGYHLDFALYGKKGDVYYHCGANEWEERNPKAISRWFNNKNQENNGILKETVKFIKFFCKQNTEWLMPGGLIISVLVEEALKKDYLNMTMDNILKNIINNIIGRLECNNDVLNPTDFRKSLIKKDKDVKKIDNLYKRLKSRISKINELTEDSNIKEICDAWNYFFGDDYFNENFELKKEECEDTEEQIENLYDVELNKNEEQLITCQLSSIEGNTTGRTLRNYESNQPLSVTRFKDQQLIFTANINCNQEYIVLWKIKNNGALAVKNNSIRGEILFSNNSDDFNYIDYNGNKRYERISFVGHHYVECYIVKNNIVVNKDRFLVNLID